MGSNTGLSLRIFIFTASAFVGVGSSDGIRAASVTITPAADTTLFEAAPFNNMGAVQSLAVGVTDNGTLARALVRFEITNALPVGAKVNNVSLSLPVVRAALLVEPATFALHRMSIGWVEGNKGAGTLTDPGAQATDGEPCWIARAYPDTFWTNVGGEPGADYVAEPTASTEFDGVAGTVLTFADTSKLVEDVQSWLDEPSANWGWLIKDESEAFNATGRRLGSLENPSSNPQLTIEFDAPLKISEVRLQGSEFCLTFEARAGQAYTVESRAAVHTGAWSTVATIPPPNTTGPVTTCDPRSSGPRFYRVVQP